MFNFYNLAYTKIKTFTKLQNSIFNDNKNMFKGGIYYFMCILRAQLEVLANSIGLTTCQNIDFDKYTKCSHGFFSISLRWKSY